MWFEEAEELLKNCFPYYLFLVLPMFIIISPVNPVCGAYEFPVYRMQHFDLHGVSHGCRSASVNLEARSLSSWSSSRHCVVAKVQDLTVDHFRNICTKAGALIVVVPNDLTTLSAEEKQHLMMLEDAMLVQEVSIAVYFITWSHDIEKILQELSSSMSVEDKENSAAEVLFSSVTANGYQVVINPKTPSTSSDIRVATVQGNLVGQVHEGKVPTIAIVAYYDSFGVAPELSFGADSNGSGVAMLLELVRLFASLYSDPKTHGQYNIIFLLSGAGKFNYQGSKKWLEDQLDSLDGSLIQDASYVLCLDTVASNDALYMHVSKPPKENSPASTFFKQLKSASNRRSAVAIEGIHKKINLADDLLAWEHERYSIRRLPAFTVSSLKSHKDLLRGTVTDVGKSLDIDRLTYHTQLVAEAIAGHVYNVSAGELFDGTLQVDKTHLKAWVDFLSSQPRSAQLLCQKENILISVFRDIFVKYLRDVRISYVVPDKRDPDFMFYDVTKSTVNVYSVKPAAFDLILTIIIVLYLGTVYLVIQNFSGIYKFACNVTVKSKVN